MKKIILGMLFVFNLSYGLDTNNLIDKVKQGVVTTWDKTKSFVTDENNQKKVKQTFEKGYKTSKELIKKGYQKTKNFVTDKDNQEKATNIVKKSYEKIKNLFSD